MPLKKVGYVSIFGTKTLFVYPFNEYLWEAITSQRRTLYQDRLGHGMTYIA